MAHIHEKIDFTTSVYIVHGAKVLLHMHKRLNIWLPPGGHIELDEDPIQAILREAREESGLEIELVGEQMPTYETKYGAHELLPPRYMNRHFFDETRSHEHVDLVYFARSQSDDARPEVESGTIRWFTRAELEDPTLDMLPDVRRYALLALKELAE